MLYNNSIQKRNDTQRLCRRKKMTDETYDITSGLGIGGVGSDDFNIHCEQRD